jgi:hypothetical protein
MHEDRYGLALTTSSAVAAERYVEALDRHLAHRDGIDDFARQAIALDDDFALAWFLLGTTQRMQGQHTEANASMARAAELEATVTERELSAMATARLVPQSDASVGERAISDHLERWPHDLFVMSQTDLLYQVVDSRPDRTERRIALFERLAPSFTDDDWYFDGEIAFAAEEHWEYGRAEDLALRSLAGNPDNGGAAHVVAHVLVETGRDQEGSQWLTDWLAAWNDPAKSYRWHLAWHNALFDLSLDAPERALPKLDGIMGGEPFPALLDGAALAWRMMLDGDDILDAPARLAEIPLAAPFPLLITHRALALALVRDLAALEALADDAEVGGDAVATEMAAWTRALAALAADEPKQAVALLEPIAPAFDRFGGSHAQTEVYEDTLIAALARAGRADEAADRLGRRIERRASGRDERWLEALARAHS